MQPVIDRAAVSVSTRRGFLAGVGAAALVFIGQEADDVSAKKKSCAQKCKKKKGAKKKACKKACQSASFPQPAEPICTPEQAYCTTLYNSQRGTFLGVTCAGAGICRCTDPGCKCTPVAGGFERGSTCSGTCTPLSCEDINPEGKCGFYHDTNCNKWKVCDGSCDVGTCNADGVCELNS